LLVTTNQEVSRIFVGSEIPIVTGYTSSASGASGTSISTIATQAILVPTTEVRTVGTSLIITPNINADRTVNLRMLVEQSSVTPNGATIPVPLTSANGQSTIQNAEVAVVNAQSYIGTILSKDRLAVAVGGLIQESSSDQVSGVPLLMDIPWLGNLFKQTNKVRSRQELIIVMRPFIQATPTEAANVRDKILEEESLHPAINDFDKNMELYGPQKRRSNDFRLQENSRLYPYQDSPKGE
jgi:general secretion pathway protein D